MQGVYAPKRIHIVILPFPFRGPCTDGVGRPILTGGFHDKPKHQGAIGTSKQLSTHLTNACLQSLGLLQSHHWQKSPQFKYA